MGWVEDVWGFSQNPFSIKELCEKDELDKLFVDREVEVRQLVNGLSSSNGGIVYGISGLRGSGKSSILNKVLEEMRKKDSLIFNVKTAGSFSELEFLGKVLTDICDQLDLANATSSLKKEVARLKTNLFYNENVSQETSSEASIRASIKASFLSILGSEVGSEIKESQKNQIMKQLKPYSKSTLTREILLFLPFLKKETKARRIVIGIDETDKCRFEDAEKLLDSIKAVLSTRDSHFIFVGTLDFYKNFSRVFSGKEEEATLASIFENIIRIPPLAKEKISEIITKRVEYYSVKKSEVKNPFTNESLEIIIEMSEGSPKQLMRLCSEGFIYFGDSGHKIKAKDLVQYFKDQEHIPDLNATERVYMEVVQKLGSVSAISDKLFDGLKERGIEHKSKTQYRVILENLFAKKYLMKGFDKQGQVEYSPSALYKNIINYN